MRLAVGLESTILGEDQILHQLRRAVAASRADGDLPSALERVADAALRAGRTARSLLPAERPSLADIALEAVGADHGSGRGVLVVGAGTMGALAARALRRRGWRVLVANRSDDRAEVLASAVGGHAVPLDPGPERVADIDGVVLAIGGPWRPSSRTIRALSARLAFVVDLSSPPALTAGLASVEALRWTIDDAVGRPDGGTARLRRRLERLADETTDDVMRWLEAAGVRDAAGALTGRASEVTATELGALWPAVGPLTDAQRAAIEAMAERVAARLLRPSLERLGRDADGRYEKAARELFGL